MNTSKIQKGLVFILVIVALLLLLSSKATPDAPVTFVIKRIQEKAFLSLKSNPAERVDYLSSLLENRLTELQSMVNNKSYGYILPSASRYSTLAGQITDLVVANKMTDKVETIRNQFLNHRQILDQIYVIYPKNTDNWEWKYIQDDYNYLKLYLDQLAAVK